MRSDPGIYHDNLDSHESATLSLTVRLALAHDTIHDMNLIVVHVTY